MNAVVNRDDASRRRQRGQHVVRRVEQIEPLAPHRERNRDLLGERIVPGAIGDGAEVLAERSRDAHVLRPRDEHIFRGLVDFRELAQQIPDVGADAEIVKLPRVDAYAHV